MFGLTSSALAEPANAFFKSAPHSNEWCSKFFSKSAVYSLSITAVMRVKALQASARNSTRSSRDLSASTSISDSMDESFAAESTTTSSD